MKKIISLIIGFVLIATLHSSGQKIYKDYFDGELYMKIKDATVFAFDTTTLEVNINQKLSFLKPLVEKYKITKVDASFYFSKSEILKRTFRIYFQKIDLVDHFLRDIERLQEIDYAEKVPIMRTDFTPNDLGANSTAGQYGLYNIQAQEAWNVSRGSSSVWIAVVDNAIDINHQDLSTNVVQSRDVSDMDNDPTPPNSSFSHGTHTSGTACASTNNGTGVSSIGFGCGLFAIKATHDVSSSTAIDNGFEGIAWAVSHGATVISCSWGGGGYSSTEQTVINDAYNNNAIVVASAGNNNTSNYSFPAAYTHVLAVAAVDINDTKAGFSNFGSWVRVSAPGVGVRSTLPGNSYGNLSGTSMACPLVAGLCGLLRSLNPSLSYDDVINCVITNADNIDAQNPSFIGQLGGGRINAYKALECALPCNGSINLGSSYYTTLKTESSGTITSANKIPTFSQVWFDAAALVSLQPGFTANDGCTFRAYIDGCGGARFAGSNLQSTELKHAFEMKVKPNPFSTSTTIEFTLDKTENISLKIFDINGRLIKTLAESIFEEGEHRIEFNAEKVDAGIYFLKLDAGDFSETKKLSVIK